MFIRDKSGTSNYVEEIFVWLPGLAPSLMSKLRVANFSMTGYVDYHPVTKIIYCDCFAPLKLDIVTVLYRINGYCDYFALAPR